MGDETVMLTIGDWTFVEVPHPETPPMMYVHHNCDEMEVMGVDDLGALKRAQKIFKSQTGH